MTLSEQIFEQFCHAGNILCIPITTGAEKTADYEINLCGVRVIVEIKQLTPNHGEQDSINEAIKIGATCGGGEIGKRVRSHIDSAKHQIEHSTSGEHPGILLLYDTRPDPFHGILPHEISAAMYGFETIDIHPSKDTALPLTFGKHRFGNGKKLRHDSHTYISALGHMYETQTDRHIHIDLYNNIHSDHKLPLTGIILRRDMTVYTLASGKRDEFRKWEKMTAHSPSA